MPVGQALKMPVGLMLLTCKVQYASFTFVKKVSSFVYWFAMFSFFPSIYLVSDLFDLLE